MIRIDPRLGSAFRAAGIAGIGVAVALIAGCGGHNEIQLSESRTVSAPTSRGHRAHVRGFRDG